MATDYKWDGNTRRQTADKKSASNTYVCTECKKWHDSFKDATKRSKESIGDIAYLRGVVRDCLILAGCEPSRPRAERRIHGIDFVASILDALRSAYDATSQYPDCGKEVTESVIREKIRKGMEEHDKD